MDGRLPVVTLRIRGTLQKPGTLATPLLALSVIYQNINRSKWSHLDEGPFERMEEDFTSLETSHSFRYT